jgi:hypothetical protein
MNTITRLNNYGTMTTHNDDMSSGLSLDQGVQFLGLVNQYVGIVGKKRLNLVERTTMDELGNLEGYATMRSNALDVKREIELSKIKELETEFNQKLAQYIDAYTQYMNDVISKNSVLSKYKNQNVMDANGNYYHINRFGVARQYSTEAWKNRDASCPSNVPTEADKDLMARVQVGMSIPLSQPCNLEGTNIRNQETGAVDWISPEGQRHHIPDPQTFDTLQKKGGCPSTYTNVNQGVYNSFQDGGNFNETSTCSTSDYTTNNPLWQSITALNQDLINIAQEMYQEVNKLSANEGKIEGEIKTMRTKLLSEINKLNNERKKLEKARQNVDSFSAEYEDNKLRLHSGYLKYMTWFLLAIGMGVYAVNHVFKK